MSFKETIDFPVINTMQSPVATTDGPKEESAKAKARTVELFHPEYISGRRDTCCLNGRTCEIGEVRDGEDSDEWSGTITCSWHAMMPQWAGRDDPSQFILWFGIHPDVAFRICDHATIAALTAHGEDVDNPTKERTDAYEAAFQAFVKALKDHRYTCRWMRDPDSPVFMAYCDFMQARRTELKHVEPSRTGQEAINSA